MKTGTCLALLLLLPSVLQAGMQVDSLYATAQAETSDSLRVSKLCDLSRDLYSQNPRRGLKIGLEVKEISRSLGDSLGLMRSHYCLGLNHWSLGEYGPALESYEESLVLARLLKEAKMEMMLENNLGVTFNARGDYLSALRYFHDSLRHQDSAGVEWMKPHTLLNIGNIHEYLGNHEEAILQFEQCADLLGDTNDLFLASIYNNLGVSYEQSGDFARAKDYHNRSREIREREGDEYAISTNLINLATILNQQGRHAEAIHLLEDALQRVQDFGDESTIVDIKIIWASSLCALSRHEEALLRLEESLRISEKTGRGEELAKIHRALCSCLVELDDLEAAYDHLVRSSELQDSLRSQDRIGEMSIAEERYERERESSQRELDRLRRQQEI
ncbi:MAG: tetratricopeptide repeat protein [Candidatus Krumholzibacteria bacterium]|nr:tetratricopeptide repeat protein [Candidatus Krumholzibacteria bacterium]